MYNSHSWYWDTRFLQSHFRNSAFVNFAEIIAIHYNLASSFHRVPITAGWTEASWCERLDNKSTHSMAMYTCYHCMGVVIADQLASLQYTVSLVVYAMSTGERHISSVDCTATCSPVWNRNRNKKTTRPEYCTQKPKDHK